jgi:hypothetical protein
VLAFLLLNCRGTTSNDKPSSASNNQEGAVARCDAYFHHVEKTTRISHVGPYNEAEYEYCRTHSFEQLECAMAATTIDDLNLCENIKDPTRRALGRKLTPSLKRSWPGSLPLLSVLTGMDGCAFAGVLAHEGMELTENQAAAAFAMRVLGATGDVTHVIVILVRTSDGDWQCRESDPANMCATLATACKN